MTQQASRQITGFLTGEKARGIGRARSSMKDGSNALFPEGARRWQEVYADRLERVISCYRNPEEQTHAARLKNETIRIVEEVKNEVRKRGVDWHTIAPPRPVGVDSGGVVLAWDEPTWGAEIEIEIPPTDGPAEVFVWADRKADTNQSDAGSNTSDEPLEEPQAVYRERLIRLLCEELTA